ncbi:MAG: hypothetical protein KKF50_01100 [Nanoarchaeota archaeon]|nr:hypothetical protein [Nanoarchaeota archaeon]
MKVLVFVLIGLFFLSLVSGVTAVMVGEDETDKELFSKEDICRIMKGCWDNHECFPNGYINEDKYCGLVITYYNVERTKFINQSDAEESCDNSFECKSNFCFNGECVDTIRTIDEGVVRINKSDLEELRSIISDAEYFLDENYDEEVSKSFFSSLSNLFKKLFSWW